ncbi:alpha/beta fold hydrolase [Streptomyces sp. NBC_00083]|uniref:alpha/beta fold hydrolase n=1 Tax=Streptomyces sp. NBC_00083 TaxID=2975647 RepID=UPI002B1D08FC|nr:alpha/beta fold hydrolase [Streptomyces sp. NBC_00083]
MGDPVREGPCPGRAGGPARRGWPRHRSPWWPARLRAARGSRGCGGLRLTALGNPLLVIFGEDDRRWRSSSAADYRAVPGARVELLPGLGHSPLLEDPPRTAAPLLAFTAVHAVRVD